MTSNTSVDAPDILLRIHCPLSLKFQEARSLKTKRQIIGLGEVNLATLQPLLVPNIAESPVVLDQ